MAVSPDDQQLLKEFQSGTQTASDRLWSDVYDELRGIATDLFVSPDQALDGLGKGGERPARTAGCRFFGAWEKKRLLN